MAVNWKELLAGLPAAIDEAVEAASRETAEALNQATRRIAQSSTLSDALSALIDSSAHFCGTAIVFSLKDGQAQALRKRGTADTAEGEPELHVEMADAPALGSVLQTKELVTAASTPGELSEALAAALGSADGRAYLYPLKVRQEVVVILAAAGSVQAGAVECLCEAASLKLEVLFPPAPPPVVAPPPPPPPIVKEIAKAPNAWASLTPEEQRIHLQAQRFTRVKVAELRLYHADAVREGRSKSDLYGVLRNEIDGLRTAFQKEFISATPTMVDYLHLELVRSLAHEDERLLGPNYPGALV